MVARLPSSASAMSACRSPSRSPVRRRPSSASTSTASASTSCARAMIAPARSRRPSWPRRASPTRATRPRSRSPISSSSPCRRRSTRPIVPISAAMLSASKTVGHAAQARRHRGLRVRRSIPARSRRSAFRSWRAFRAWHADAISRSAIRRSGSIPATRRIGSRPSPRWCRAGSTRTLDIVAEVYGSVVTAGIHRAPSIKVAEAAKVIENTQRDLNIAFMNELSAICHALGHRYRRRAGGRPAPSGTSCRSIRDWSAATASASIHITSPIARSGPATHHEVILAGRQINDGVGRRVARECVRMLMQRGGAAPTVTVLGLTFKENVPDIRNSKVVDIVRELVVVRNCGAGARSACAAPTRPSTNTASSLRRYRSCIRPMR